MFLRRFAKYYYYVDSFCIDGRVSRTQSSPRANNFVDFHWGGTSHSFNIIAQTPPLPPNHHTEAGGHRDKSQRK